MQPSHNNTVSIETSHGHYTIEYGAIYSLVHKIGYNYTTGKLHTCTYKVKNDAEYFPLLSRYFTSKADSIDGLALDDLLRYNAQYM